MKRTLILSALMAALSTAYPLHAATVRTATETFVTNRIATATNAVYAAAKDYTDDAIASAGGVTPEMVTNIVNDVAPAPGDYATVSNRAMRAVLRDGRQQTISGGVQLVGGGLRVTTSTALGSGGVTITPTQVQIGDTESFTDFSEDGISRWQGHEEAMRLTFPDASGTIAVTNDVQLTPLYTGTPTFSEWTFADVPTGVSNMEQPVFYEGSWSAYFTYGSEDREASASGDIDAVSLSFFYSDQGLSLSFTATRTRTDIIGYTLGAQTDKPIASTNDLARASAIPSVVINIVRDLSLGGIWDSQLEVWWTPRMRNGSLTYEATTNVNLNAEN